MEDTIERLRSIYCVLLRNVRCTRVMMVMIRGLFVLAFVYGAPLKPERYEFRYSESQVFNYHDSFQFDKIDISLEDGDVPVFVELIARQPPPILLPRAFEYHELDLNQREARSFTWNFVANSRMNVHWDSSCNLRVVMVKTLDALKDLTRDHAPKQSLVLFDITDYNHNVTGLADSDNYYSIFALNMDAEPCTSDLNLTISRHYYDVTRLNAGERGDQFVYNPNIPGRDEHVFIDSPAYPLVIFYTGNATGTGPVSPTHMNVAFHPDRRIDLTVIVLFFILGFLFVVGGMTVMVMSTQKTFILYREIKMMKLYTPPEYVHA